MTQKIKFVFLILKFFNDYILRFVYLINNMHSNIEKKTFYKNDLH